MKEWNDDEYLPYVNAREAADVQRKAAISYCVQAHKDWNFNYCDTFAGIDFAPFVRLHEAGLAMEFDVYGTTGLLNYGG